MAKLNAKARKALPKSDFAVKSKAGTPQGKAKGGSYPIPDESHAQNALSRSSGKPIAGKVRAAVKKKFPGMKVKADNPKVRKAATNIKQRLSAKSKNRTEVGF